MTIDGLDKEFYNRVLKDEQLLFIKSKVRDGTATFADTAEYNSRVSSILGNLLSGNIDSVPEGEREKLCKYFLRHMYDDTNEMCSAVQQTVDKVNGVEIQPQKAAYPTERVDKVAHSLEDPTVPIETIKRRAGAPVENVAKSFHDDYVEENAKFRAKAGLDTFIIRESHGGCCEWCAKYVGKYRYPYDVPRDVYRRHDNCGCTVTYENDKSRQDVWSKRTWQADGKAVEEKVSEGNKLVKYTPEQARNLEKSLDISAESGIIKVENDSEHVQNYRPVTFDGEIKRSRGEMELTLQHCDTTVNDVYVSDRCSLKPKELHNLDVRFSNAVKEMGISDRENLPAVYVINNTEMQKNAIASYNAVTNVISIDETFGKKLEQIIAVQSDGACPENELSTVVHELFHWSDAQEYQKNFGKITAENYDNYVKHLNSNRKKLVEKLGINGDNVESISGYADASMKDKDFDEVFTEYRVKILLSKG